MPFLQMTLTSNGARPFASRSGWLVIGLLSLGWLLVNVHITVHFRMLDSDSIMYGLPLAVAKSPFDLKIPFIGDFESYGRTWGHQWPGAMWVRAGIFSIVSFSRELDIGFNLICQWLTAFLAAGLVWRVVKNRWLALAVALVVISDRQIFMSVQLHRFETLAGLSIMALLAFAWRAGPVTPWYWRVAGYAGAFFAPTMHPYTGPLAVVVLGALLLKAFWFRQCRRRDAMIACAFFAAGFAALAAWFLLQPGALEQYTRNVALQKGFSSSYGVVWRGLAHYHFQSGRILWLLAALCSLGVLLGKPRALFSFSDFPFFRFALPGIVLGLLFLQTITRCNNQAYLTLGHATAGIVIAIYAVALTRTPLRFVGLVLGAVFVLISLLWGTLTPYRVRQYQKAGFPDLKKVADDLLLAVPAGRKVYLPPPLWDSASRLGLAHEYRLWTFAVASSKERRLAYEKWAYEDKKLGDVLIVDRLSTRRGDVWGILPVTEGILFPDPVRWRKTGEMKRLFPGTGLDFGYDFEIYEYVGEGKPEG